MKNPGPGDVSWAAIRLAALPAPNGVAGLASLSKLRSTIMLIPLVGRLAATSLAKRTWSATPNTAGANAKTSDAITKLMEGSPPTTCRPGVVSAVEPANGSDSKLNVTPAFVVALRVRSAAAARTVAK